MYTQCCKPSHYQILPGHFTSPGRPKLLGAHERARGHGHRWKTWVECHRSVQKKKRDMGMSENRVYSQL